MSLESISKILGADTVKKIYKDGLTEPVKETGKLLTDFVKAARLFTAPIQLLASYQDRLSKHFENVRNSVPDENQIEAPAFISGPIIEKLKYLEDSSYLTDLYLNLLSRAIDKERINEAHPAFPHVIDQLSPDEAMILFVVSQEPIYYDYTMDLITNEKGQSRFVNSVVKKNTTPVEKINFISNFDMYIRHMESLNLVFWRKVDENSVQEGNIQIGTYINSRIELTEFGALFAKACIPKDGFVIVK